MNPFAKIINRDVPDIPTHEGVESFSALARKDKSPVEGWSWRPKNPGKGTIFYLHGFCDNCRNPGSWPHWIKCAEKFDMAMVAFDFRHHGRSSDRWPSFGTGESWDLRGAMDRAEELGFPRPFITIGGSLGAMAAQRAAVGDERISGCYLAEPPECPWHAIGSTVWGALPKPVKLLAVSTPILGQLINFHYKWDILNNGDVRNHKAIHNPPHRPLIYFVMGKNDNFEIPKTRKIFDQWYSECPGISGSGFLADNELEARKWFVEVPDCGHNELYGKWQHYGSSVHSFIKRCLREADLRNEKPPRVSESTDSPTPSAENKSPDSTVILESSRSPFAAFPSKTNKVLYVDVGGTSIRAAAFPNWSPSEFFEALEENSEMEMQREIWNPKEQGKEIGNIITKLLSDDDQVERAVISIAGEVSSNGRGYKGWMRQKGVPEDLASHIEKKIGLTHGSVTLLNDAAA